MKGGNRRLGSSLVIFVHACAALCACYDASESDDRGAADGGVDAGRREPDAGGSGRDSGGEPDAGGTDAGQSGGDAGADAASADTGATDSGQTADGEISADVGGDSGAAASGAHDGGGSRDAETPTPLSDATPGWFGQLAYSPPNNSWLVTAQAGGVVGRIMGNDGSPVTPVFSIGPPEQNTSWVPSVAYASDTDTYLVVWVDYTDGGWQAWGRFVNGDGSVPGAAFALALDKPVGNQGGDRTSALVYDPKNKRFVYVWSGTHLATIDMGGNLGPIVDMVEASPNEHWGASVAANPDKNEYCVAYDLRNAGGFGVTRVDAANLSAGAGTAVGITTTNVLVAYNPVERNYLVAYDNGYVIGVKAKVLNSCDVNDVRNEFDVVPKVSWSSLAYNPVSNMFAVIDQNANDDGNTYTVFDSSGAVLTSGDPFLGGSQGNFSPEIAPNTKDGTFAAISSREYSQTRFVANIGFKASGGR